MVSDLKILDGFIISNWNMTYCFAYIIVQKFLCTPEEDTIPTFQKRYVSANVLAWYHSNNLGDISFGTPCITKSTLTLFEPNLINFSRIPGGSRSAHHWIFAIWWHFYLYFLDRVLALDVKGQNLRAQHHTLKTVVLRFFLRIFFLGTMKTFCKFSIGKPNFLLKKVLQS